MGASPDNIMVSATATVAMKRAALDWVHSEHGVPHEAMVAIGDHDNDLEAVQAAGLGVAVQTATRAVLTAADRVVGPPEEDPVAALLEELTGAR